MPFPPWRISQASRCPRALVFQRLSEKPLEVGPHVRLAARKGLAQESVMLGMLQREGWEGLDYWNSHPERSVRIERGGVLLLTGHPDALIWQNNLDALAEFKLVNQVWFRQLSQIGVRAMFPEYYAQMQLYLEATGLDICLLVASESRGRFYTPSGRVYRERVHKDQAEIDRLVEIVSRSQHCGIADLSCHESPRIRRYCAFRYLCRSIWMKDR